MFDKKTLFIIGAGASSEFNLPVGSELRHLIADFLVQTPDGGRGSSIVAVNEAPLATAIQALPHRRPGGGVPDEYKTAAFTIRDNMYHEDSIDQFLHLMRDDQVITDLGKMSIAWIICQSEGKSKMAVPQRPAFQHYEETWLNIFGKTLFDGVSRNTITKALSMVSVVCFNYDRCIETHLMRVLQTRFGLTPDQAAAEVSNFSIVHPYGQIGALPWQRHDAPEVGFGDTDQMARCLHLMPAQLRTFTETDYSDLTMKANLTTMMSEAERVIFLGFSYNDLNMDLLQKHGQIRTTECFGTIKSMPSSAVERAKKLVARLVSDIVVEGDRSIRVQAVFERFDTTCYTFLSERRAHLTMPTSGLS